MYRRTTHRPAPVFVTADGGRYPRLDRNERVQIVLRAEALDRRTHQPGQHGGVLKRTGLAVLRALLFGFHNIASGRCDPGYDALARAAGVARSTVALALDRLEAAGLVVRIARVRRVRVNGAVVTVQASNAYHFPVPESESRPQTTNKQKNQRNQSEGPRKEEEDAVRGFLPELQRALARLGHAMADRRSAGEGAGPAGGDGRPAPG